MSRRSFSSPALVKGGGGGNDLDDLGDLHIRRQIANTKEKLRQQRTRLDDTLRMSAPLAIAGGCSTNGWVEAPGWSTLSFDRYNDAKMKFVGQGANELSKWMNAERITRRREETNLAIPTLRQIMKVDDIIDMKQMTKSQLAALPADGGLDKGAKKDPLAKQRHVTSYRSGRVL